jgi:hypothetical protein
LDFGSEEEKMTTVTARGATRLLDFGSEEEKMTTVTARGASVIE